MLDNSSSVICCAAFAARYLLRVICWAALDLTVGGLGVVLRILEKEVLKLRMGHRQWRTRLKQSRTQLMKWRMEVTQLRMEVVQWRTGVMQLRTGVMQSRME
ncbi:MAG: hypothetical protein WCQ95_01620 [Bacteroidota bacterium]